MDTVLVESLWWKIQVMYNGWTTTHPSTLSRTTVYPAVVDTAVAVLCGHTFANAGLEKMSANSNTDNIPTGEKLLNLA